MLAVNPSTLFITHFVISFRYGKPTDLSINFPAVCPLILYISHLCKYGLNLNVPWRRFKTLNKLSHVVISYCSLVMRREPSTQVYVNVKVLRFYRCCVWTWHEVYALGFGLQKWHAMVMIISYSPSFRRCWGSPPAHGLLTGPRMATHPQALQASNNKQHNNNKVNNNNNKPMLTQSPALRCTGNRGSSNLWEA